MTAVTYKALSLWQPWATLMAAGYKRNETRSWPPRGLHEGELVLIHAAKHYTVEERGFARGEWIANHYLTLAAERGLWSFDDPPLGALIAVAQFYRAARTEDVRAHQSDTELVFGNYAPSRWAWRFPNVIPIRPIPWRGAQGLFTVELPVGGLEFLEPTNSTDASLKAYVPAEVERAVKQVAQYVEQLGFTAAQERTDA